MVKTQENQQQSQNNQKISQQNNLNEESFTSYINYLSQRNYQFVRYIFKGQYGAIIEASSSRQRKVGIKMFQYQEENQDIILNEVKILEKVKNHKYLFNLIEFINNTQLKVFFLVSELYDCTLQDIINYNSLSQSQVYSITKHLLEGLIELKNLGIIHFNIQPQNILYSQEKNKFLISDFRTSQIVNDNIYVDTLENQERGSLIYMAPEIFQKSIYTEHTKRNQINKITNRIDIFSLGNTLISILKGQFTKQDIFQIKKLKFKEMLPKNSSYQNYIDRILMNMLKESQEDRMEPTDLLNILLQEFKFNENDLKFLSIQEKKEKKTQENKNIQDLLQLKSYNNLSQYKCHSNISINLNNTLLNQNVISLEGVSSLSKKLKCQTMLSNLNLDLSRNGIGAEGVLSLSNGLKCLTKLSCLNLNLIENGIGEEGVSSLSNGLKCLSLLNNLNLNLTCNGIRAKGVSFLSQGLKYLTQLNNLILNLAWNSIEAEGVSSLLSGLECLTNLIDLNLNLSENGIGEEGISFISERLKCLTRLTNLNLDLYWNNISLEGVLSLQEKLKSLNLLTNINLNHEQNGNKQREVQFQLQQLKYLSNLNLNPLFFKDLSEIINLDTFHEEQQKQDIVKLLHEYFNLFINETNISLENLKKQEQFYLQQSKINVFQPFKNFYQSLVNNYFLASLKNINFKEKYQQHLKDSNIPQNKFQQKSFSAYFEENFQKMYIELEKQTIQFFKENINQIKSCYLIRDINSLFSEFNLCTYSLDQLKLQELLSFRAQLMRIPLSQSSHQMIKAYQTQDGNLKEKQNLIVALLLLKEEKYQDCFIQLCNFYASQNEQIIYKNKIQDILEFCIQQLEIKSPDESLFLKYLLYDTPLCEKTIKIFKSHPFFETEKKEKIKEQLENISLNYKIKLQNTFQLNDKINYLPLKHKKDENNIPKNQNQQNNNQSDENIIQNNQNNNTQNNQNLNSNPQNITINNNQQIQQQNQQKNQRILCLQETGVRIIPILYQLDLLEQISGKQCDDIFDFIVANSDCGFIALLLRKRVKVSKIFDFILKKVHSKGYNKKIQKNWFLFFNQAIQKNFKLELEDFEEFQEFKDNEIFGVSCMVQEDGNLRPVCFVKYKLADEYFTQLFEINQMLTNQQLKINFSGLGQKGYNCFQHAPLQQIVQISSAEQFIDQKNKFNFDDDIHSYFKNKIFVNGNLIFDNVNYLILEFLRNIGNIQDFTNYYILSYGSIQIDFSQQQQQQNEIIMQQAPQNYSNWQQQRKIIEEKQKQSAKQNLYQAYKILEKKLVMCRVQDLEEQSNQFDDLLAWNRNQFSLMNSEYARIFFLNDEQYIIFPSQDIIHQNHFQILNDFVNNNYNDTIKNELQNQFSEVQSYDQLEKLYKKNSFFSELKQNLININIKQRNTNYDTNGFFDKLFSIFVKKKFDFLCFASSIGSTEIIQLLEHLFQQGDQFKMGNYLNCRFKNNWKPIHFAATNGEINAFVYLVDLQLQHIEIINYKSQMNNIFQKDMRHLQKIIQSQELKDEVLNIMEAEDKIQKGNVFKKSFENSKSLCEHYEQKHFLQVIEWLLN